jgi:antitoxin (DNA-binding transcriptional repressor) of toxin-antitoxin stability system
MRAKKHKSGGAVREVRVAYRTRRKLSATEASRNFSEILNLTRYRGESFLVMRAGEPVCEIKPAKPPRFTVADLAELLNDLPPIDEDYLHTVEELSRSQPSLPASPWEP